ncbi:hypothetical protein NQZ68_018545 [Dissostichus eleginoides]|nr:hypothetical protein NQZ68_018545 [Dissostichus eleginoides]
MSEFRRIIMSSFLMLLLHFTVTEHQDNDEVTLRCSVTRRGQCEHKVKWLLEGQDVVKDHRDIKTSQSRCWWWWIIVVIVGVAALTIITVAVIRRKRTQGTRTETDDDMADPEDGVSYASISFTRKSSSKARAHLHDDDEDDAVTYSTVRAPSSSSAASV